MKVPKNLPEGGGVYCITNRKTGEQYVGGSFTLKSRINTHVSEFLRGRHTHRLLRESCEEHGLNAFVFTILEECEIEKVRMQEQAWINKLDPAFNITRVKLRSDQYHGMDEKELRKFHRLCRQWKAMRQAKQSA